MAGLVAIVSRDPREHVSEEAVAGLARDYEALRGSGDQLTASAGGAARVTVVLGNGASAGIDRQDGSWTAFVGRPYGERPLAGADVSELDGQFALVSHDARSGELVVAADPFAMQAVFVAERGSLTYVSTSALALARHLRAEPDRFALETFLRSGYHFGARTHWAGIERLEPATRLALGPDGTRRRDVYWRPEVDGAVARLGLENAARRCSDVAVDAIQRRYAGREKTWADLTGGFDTRLLVLLLDRAGVTFACNTRGDVGDDDRVLAHRIAEHEGWRLLDPVVPADWAGVVREVIPRAVAWSDGQLQALEPSWVLWVHRLLAEQGGGLLSGGGGEHWRGFAWSQEFHRAGRSTSVNMDNWIGMRLLHPLDADVLARDVERDVREDLRERMTRWTEPYLGERNTLQLDVMYAYKMTGHFAAYRSADLAYLDAELPFYLKDVFTAAISVDYRHRSRHKLMRHVIAELDPVVAALDTSTGGPAAPWRPAQTHRYVPYYTRVGRRAVTKLGQKLLGRSLLDSPDVSWWAPPAVQAVGIDVLGPTPEARAHDMRSLRLYDAAALEGYLERALAGDVEDAELLGRIVSVELALRMADASVDS